MRLYTERLIQKQQTTNEPILILKIKFTKKKKKNLNNSSPKIKY